MKQKPIKSRLKYKRATFLDTTIGRVFLWRITTICLSCRINLTLRIIINRIKSMLQMIIIINKKVGE